MRVVVLTSDHLRHLYFAARLAENFEVIQVIAESKAFHPESTYRSPEEQAILDRWFAMRVRAEEEFFGDTARDFQSRATGRIKFIPAGDINSSETIAFLNTLAPDVVTVFGSSLLRRPLLDILGSQAINMHLGLSPFYRGSGTNFWPFYNGELEYVGVTIHKIDAGIDSGSIFHQGRPFIEQGDNPHTIGCKTIIVGTGLMIQTLHELDAGMLQSVPQPTGVGRLYKRKDFGAQEVAVVFQKLQDGLIEQYLMQLPPSPDIIP